MNSVSLRDCYFCERERDREVQDLLAEEPRLVVMGDLFRLVRTLDEMELTAGLWLLWVTSSFCF